MTSVQSRISRSLVIGSVGLEELQYQTWSYLIEIDRVTNDYPYLTVRLASPYLCSVSLP
jgi:hypothetical protein